MERGILGIPFTVTKTNMQLILLMKVCDWEEILVSERGIIVGDTLKWTKSYLQEKANINI